MSTPRIAFYQRLMTYEPLLLLHQERVWAKKAMTSSVEGTPYLVYKMGNDTDISLSESDQHNGQFCQVWVHDFSDGKIADYVKIDEVIRAVKAAFHLWNDPESGIIAVQYLETSQDLNDETLNTVFRYLRFQMITKETP